MQPNRALLLMTAAAMALGGCTTQLSTTPDRVRTASNREALTGTPYALPMLQYDLSVERKLTTCETQVEIDADGKELLNAWLPNVAFAVTATGVPNAVEGERYLIDYRAMQSWLKVTGFSIEYYPDSDLLKSVNATIEDTSAEVIIDVVKTGVAVAGLVSGAPGAATIAALATANSVWAVEGGDIAKFTELKGNFETFALREGASSELLQYKALKPTDYKALLRNLVTEATAQRSFVGCAEIAATNLKARDDGEAALETKRETLAELNRAIEVRLPLATARALTRNDREAFVKLLDEQRALLATIAADEIVQGKRDKRFAVSSAERWPKNFSDAGPGAVAGLKDDALATLAGMLTSVTKPVLDQDKLAKRLSAMALDAANKPNRLIVEQFRKLYPEFIAAYLFDNGSARAFKDSQYKGCADSEGTVDVRTCVASSLIVEAALVPVVASQLRWCDDKLAGAECLGRIPSGKPVADRKTPAAPTANDLEIAGIVSTAARDRLADGGMFVRPPIRGRLQICQKPAPTAENKDPHCGPDSPGVAKAEATAIPQLGQLRFLPLHNSAFQNNGLVLNVGKLGYIEKFEYKNSKAIAQQLAATASGAATQIAEYKKARDKEAKDAIEAAQAKADPLTVLKGKIDLLENQDKLHKLENPEPADPDAAAKAALAADTLRRKDEIENLTAQSLQIKARRELAAIEKEEKAASGSN